MASKKVSSLVLFLALRLFFFVLSDACVFCADYKLPKPKPKPKPKPTPVRATSSPKDAVKLGVCANVLDELVNIMGSEPTRVDPCCNLMKGLADLEVATCLCTAIKAKVLGINLDAPVSLSLLLNACGNQVPKDFQCT